MFSPDVYEKIEKHAIDRYPQESCGLIVEGKGYVRCRNVHKDPENEFKILPSEFNKWAKKGKILALVHSHPDGPDYPSESDMSHQISSAIPWGIVCTNGEKCLPVVWFGDQVPVPALTRRPFRHGVTDCYALIRDYYRLERGITLREFPRDWEWWENGQDLYSEGFQKAGFKRTHGNLEVGDVLLMQVGKTSVPNHGAVYSKNGLILHHLTSRLGVDESRLSVEEPLGRWQKYITHHLRYVDND